jgi:hypothetical protein
MKTAVGKELLYNKERTREILPQFVRHKTQMGLVIIISPSHSDRIRLGLFVNWWRYLEPNPGSFEH